MILKEIYVENFKSLKECRIKLEKFNVVVGQNASGKSNLVDVFRLLKKIYVERADNPFIEWWGYRNVVSDHKEELPITIQLKFEDEKDKGLFEVVISGTGGSFEIIKEIFEVKGLRIEKEEHKLIIEYQGLGKVIVDRNFPSFERFSPFHHFLLDHEFWDGLSYAKEKFEKEHAQQIPEILNVLTEITKNPRYSKKALKISDLIKNTIILKDINVVEIKSPINPTKSITLAEDGRNMVNVLYNLFLENGQIPDGIKTLVSYIFPNTKIKFKLTEDGRVLMNISENELNLLPPNISNGFFKFLTIITALELKPALIIIDELENSLYPKTIELIVDEFKNSETQAIITTHSPVVVDLVYPDIKDLVLVKKENGKSSFISVEDEEKIREELDKYEITLSEKWLYGRIDKYSDKK